MTKDDLEQMSKDDLEKLRKEVDRALKSVDSRRRTEALKAAEEAARQYGFSLTELGPETVKKGRGRKPATPAKYRHPENPELTWSGRGRKPAWFHEAIEQGRSEEELAV